MQVNQDTEIGPGSDLGRATIGYGNPTIGEYSIDRKGWHTFGTVGQGSTMQGVKEFGS